LNGLLSSKGRPMSIFGSILSKIIGAAETVADKAFNPTAQAAPGPASTSPQSAPATTPSPPSANPSSVQNVDVEAILSKMAEGKGGGGNWRTSIVDLLKLLDLDSSLSARKELANELNTHAGADGTAEENVALHKAVMQKLAENGGRVPESMKG
jgi:Domain of unknown function (DUF3597)